MKMRYRVMVAAAVLSALFQGTAIAAGTAYGPASEIEQAQREKEAAGETALQTKTYTGDVNDLQAAREATQLIVVVGNPADPAQGTLSWYKRDENGRLVQVLSVPAVSGMYGITENKAEGDKKTPAGVYSFTMAFGLKENPGTILPYHQIVEGDYYVDDSASRYYNQLVNVSQVQKDWNSAEDLIHQVPHYNYGLVLNYNPECTPGKGSAIFLHCPKASNNTGTSGCISIPEEYMRQIACQADEGTRIVVVQQESDLAAY